MKYAERSDAERSIVEGLGKRPASGEGQSPQQPPVQEISADFIANLILGRVTGADDRPIAPPSWGLQLSNMHVKGLLDLSDAAGEGADTLPPLILDRCWFAEPVVLNGARFAQLSLKGSRFKRLEADRCRIDGDVDLEGIASSETDADATGAELEVKKKAVDAQQQSVKIPQCSVSLKGARIGGELRIANAKLAAAHMEEDEQRDQSKANFYALDLTSARIGGDLVAQPNLVAKGGIKLRGARFESDVWLYGAELYAANGAWAIDARGADVRGRLSAGSIVARGVICKGKGGQPDYSKCADFSEAIFGGTVELSYGIFEAKSHLNGSWALDAQNADFKHDLNCVQISGRGQFDLRGAKIGGSFNFLGAANRAPSELSLYADDLDVTGPAHIAGEISDFVYLNRARLRSTLKFGGVSRDFQDAPLLLSAVNARDKRGVFAESIEVGADVEIEGTLAGPLNLKQATINGALRIRSLTFHSGAKFSTPALCLEDATLKGALELDDKRQGGPIRSMSRTFLTGMHRPLELARSRTLSCYPGWRAVELVAVDAEPGQALAFLALWDNDARVVLLDGGSAAIHDFNDPESILRRRGERPFLDLGSDGKVIAYLKFFCASVWGDEGAFTIIEPRGAAADAKTKPPKVVERREGGVCVVEAKVHYGAAVFRAKFAVKPSGEIEMEHDEQLREAANPVRYSSPSRTIEGVSDSSALFNQLPEPFARGWEKLDRESYHRFVGAVEKPPIQTIDLSGLSCAALNDNDGVGWQQNGRYSFEFALDGVSFNRFRNYSGPASRPRSDGGGRPMGQFREKMGDAAAPEKSRKQRARDRVDWLEAQRPESRSEQAWSPQPWSAFAQAYRRHGFIEESNVILARKAHRQLEWMWAPPANPERRRRPWLNLGLLIPRLLAWLSFRGFWGGGFRWGLAPWRAAAVCVTCLAIGWGGVQAANSGEVPALVLSSTLVATEADGSAVGVSVAEPSRPPRTDIPCEGAINPLTYAVDVFIPLIDLREESVCTVRSGEWGWSLLKALYALLGWLVISLTIFTWSGPMRRQTDI